MFKLIKMGDSEGVGSIVQHTNFWGKTSTYTFLNNISGLDKWVCREDGDWALSLGDTLERFYKSCYTTGIK